MKIIGEYNRKYLLTGVSLDILIAAFYFLIPQLYKPVTLLAGILFWIAIVFLLFKNYRQRARSFLIGLIGPLVFIFIVSIIVLLVFTVTKG